MRNTMISLVLVFIFLLTPWAFAGIDKAVVKSIDFEKDGVEAFIRVTVELYSTEGGEAYLETIANYDGKDYTTLPLRMVCAFPYRTFTFLLHKEDFRLVNLEEGIDQELPEFVEERSIVAYVYGKKVTSAEDQATEDVKADLVKRRYALREVLAKGTRTIKWGNKK